MAALLSQYNLTSYLCGIPRFDKRCFNQVISQQVEAMALYSASAENREIVVCFFLFQEIGDSPSRMQYKVTDHLVSL